MFSSNDRAARDRVVDDLKKKISDEKRLLERRVDSNEKLDPDDRPYRAKKLSEVFEAMGLLASRTHFSSTRQLPTLLRGSA